MTSAPDRAPATGSSPGNNQAPATEPAPATGRPVPPSSAERVPPRRERIAWGLVGLVAAIGAWWAVTAVAGPSSPMLAAFAPQRIPGALADLLASGVLVQDMATSTVRLLGGMLVAVALGVPVGVLVGMHGPTRWAAMPAIQFVRMISPLSWAPVAVALLGVGSAPVVFLVAAAAIWPILLGTTGGVAQLDHRLVRVAYSLGASRREILRTVVAPSLRPHVLASVRLALGIAWVVLVPAEMLGVSSGLGYQILNARDQLAYDEMLVVILVIGALGSGIDALARRLLAPRA